MNTGRVIVKTLIKVYDGITDENGNPIPVKDVNNNIITKPNNVGDPDYIPSFIDYNVCPDFIHTPPTTTTTTTNQVTTTQTTTQPQVTTTTVNPCANFLITGLSLDCTGSLYNVLAIFGTGIINGSVNVTITQSSILYNQAVTFLNGVGYINLGKGISGSVAVQINQGNCGNSVSYNISCGSTTTINNPTTTLTTTTNQVITTTQNQGVTCYNVVFTNENDEPADIAYNCNGVVNETIPANSCISRSSQNGNWALPSGVTVSLNGTCNEITTTQNNGTTTTQNPACIQVTFTNDTEEDITVAYICGTGHNIVVPANDCVVVYSENGNWALNGCTSSPGDNCGEVTTTTNTTTQNENEALYQIFSCIGGVVGTVKQVGFVGLANGTVVNVNGTCHTITGVTTGTSPNSISQSFNNCNDCAGIVTTTNPVTTTTTTTNLVTTTTTTTTQNCINAISVNITQV